MTHPVSRHVRVPMAIWAPVSEFFKQDLEKVSLWMQTPNPMLEGFAPFQLIAAGRTKYLQKRIEDIVKSTHNIVKVQK